jgi:uncharacterized membrane protein YphA (DoxX/SURF4 family)
MNSRISWAKWGLLLARIAVSGIFLVAGLLKLKDAELTLIAIFQYQLVSWEHAGLLGALLPWFEIVGALGLWWPKGRLGAAALCSGLTLVFSRHSVQRWRGIWTSRAVVLVLPIFR